MQCNIVNWSGLFWVWEGVKVPQTSTAFYQTTPESFYLSFTTGENNTLSSSLLQQGPTASYQNGFHGSSPSLSVTSILRQEWSWLNWMCLGFQTSCPQQHELHGFGETLLCCAWLCVSMVERNEWLWPSQYHLLEVAVMWQVDPDLSDKFQTHLHQVSSHTNRPT